MTPAEPSLANRSESSRPDEVGDGTTQKMQQDARDAKREVGARAREEAEAGQQRVASEAGNLSDAIDAAAASLDENDRDGLARYARQMSSSLAAAAGQLEGRSVDQLADDAKRLARDNPALFMLGSVAVGFGLSRFFKASEQHESKASTQRNDDPVAAPPAGQPGTRMNEQPTTAAAPGSGDRRDTL